MNYYEENLSRLIRHFERGCKMDCFQKLGLEVEHFIVDKSTGKSVSYYGERGVEAILREMEGQYPHSYYREIIFWGCTTVITPVPGTGGPAGDQCESQREISHIRQIYRHFISQITPVLESYGYRLVTRGYQPVSRAAELPLIPKKRYACMDDYFKTSGSRGLHMMRGTASAQISIDYFSQEDCVRKMRAAYILGPAIKLLTDCTPVFEGQPAKGHLTRTAIWRDVDPKRCGICPGLFSEDFGFRSYAEYLMRLPLIFVPEAGEQDSYVRDRTAADIWKEEALSPGQVEHILSMTFLDVRLKHYLELRAADSMPFSHVCAYLALVKGIFFHEDALARILAAPVGEKEILAAEDSLMEKGFAGEIYGLPAAEYCRMVVRMAKSHLRPDEQALLQPMEQMIEENSESGTAAIKEKRNLTQYYEE
ncbi:MAG: glutamate-cysteine ligase family protein [Lachnospiraceae bacterium]